MGLCLQYFEMVVLQWSTKHHLLSTCVNREDYGVVGEHSCVCVSVVLHGADKDEKQVLDTMEHKLNVVGVVGEVGIYSNGMDIKG